MVSTSISARAAFTDDEWDAFVRSSGRTGDQHRREAVRLRQRAAITRMSDEAQIFWFGDTLLDRAARHTKWADDVDAAVSRLTAQRATG